MTRSVLAALAVAALTAPISARAESDADAVAAVVSSLNAAILGGDANAAARAYEPEAAVMFDPKDPTRGTQAIAEAFRGFVAMKPEIGFTAEEQVIVAGDLALHIAPWTMTGTAPDGTQIEDGGLSVAVLRRGDDGNWLLVIDQPYGAGH